MPKEQTQAANGAADSSFPTTITRVLQGVTISGAPKFKPGHVLTASEALFASSMHFAAARSAFEDQARAMRDENRVVDDKKVGAASDEEVQKAFAAYYSEYEWSARGEAQSLDPLQAKVRQIARVELNDALRAAGKTLQGAGKEAQDFALEQWIEAHRARLEKEAQKQLDKAKTMLSPDFLAQIQARNVGESAAQTSGS